MIACELFIKNLCFIHPFSWSSVLWWIRRKWNVLLHHRSVTESHFKTVYYFSVLSHSSVCVQHVEEKMRNEVFHTQGNNEITFCAHWVAEKKKITSWHSVFLEGQFLWNMDWKMKIFKESFGNRLSAWGDELVFCIDTQCKPLTLHPGWKKCLFFMQ